MGLRIKLIKKRHILSGGDEVEIGDVVFDQSTTHNLTVMAREVGLYEALWRPEEISAKTGKDITAILSKCLLKLRSNPDHYKKFTPKNGWGTYKDLVKLVDEYLGACIKHPDGIINISR